MLIACSNFKSNPIDENILPVDSINNHQTQNDTLLNNWVKDSLGCLHIRNYETGIALSKKYALTSKSNVEVAGVLGTPNKIIVDGKTKVLRYYYNTCCVNGVLSKECDYAWVDFTFADSTISKCIITGGVM